MGWANCGTDSKGRPIGYAHEATCDQPGCTKVIHRGLAYACGDMHGENDFSCEGYFCGEHLFFVSSKVLPDDRCAFLCKGCIEKIDKDEEEEES
jgi:hypothetical protein